MARQPDQNNKPQRNLRFLVDKVHVDVTTAIVLLATLSVLALGVIIWMTIRQDLLKEDLIRQITAEQQLSPQMAETVEQSLLEGQSITLDKVLRTIVLVTPITVAIAGVAAFFAARRILRPIRESQRLQRQFIQDAAHELRNPLAAVQATVQSLRVRRNLSKQEISSSLDSVERQLSQLIAINENLLFLGDLKTPDRQDLTLSDLLRDVIEDLHPMANDKNIEIRTAITDNISYKIAVDDFVKLARNLIENAIKYSPKGAKPIEVVLTQTAYRTRLRVKDHGVGIPKGQAKLITQRFYRASNAQTQEGTGLGMSIVQKIVQTYGATLNIKHREPTGTIVTITF